LIELVLRIGFSLLIVFGLMWALARVVRRPLGAGRGPGAIAVLQRQQLSRGSSIAVVQVAGKALVLGVTDQHVSLLGETDLAAFDKDASATDDRKPVAVDSDVLGTGATTSRRPWDSALEFLRDRTTRH
jgi:flagellar protein FliO/FliZ